jgi:UDPglucose 6-dehydrogenase
MKNTAFEKGADFAQFSTLDKIFDECDGIILATEWDEFTKLDFNLIGQKLRHKVVFDGRNVFSKNELEKLGFEYFGIGV